VVIPEQLPGFLNFERFCTGALNAIHSRFREADVVVIVDVGVEVDPQSFYMCGLSAAAGVFCSKLLARSPTLQSNLMLSVLKPTEIAFPTFRMLVLQCRQACVVFCG
jgi:hypothetical protein